MELVKLVAEVGALVGGVEVECEEQECEKEEQERAQNHEREWGDAVRVVAVRAWEV